MSFLCLVKPKASGEPLVGLLGPPATLEKKALLFRLENRNNAQLSSVEMTRGSGLEHDQPPNSIRDLVIDTGL
jgi:hypothetical protein